MNRRLEVRLDDATRARLATLAAESGKTQSAIIRRLITVAAEDDTTPTISSMDARLAGIERQMAVLVAGLSPHTATMETRPTTTGKSFRPVPKTGRRL